MIMCLIVKIYIYLKPHLNIVRQWKPRRFVYILLIHTMWSRRCLCTSVRRNECGVQLGLDRQLWEQKTCFITHEIRSLHRTRNTEKRRSWRKNDVQVKLTNGTEVEEERQFSSAGQAGVGLTQLIEEGVRTRLQGRQPGHRRVFQQSRAEGDGLWRGAGLKHLAERGEI